MAKDDIILTVYGKEFDKARKGAERAYISEYGDFDNKPNGQCLFDELSSDVDVVDLDLENRALVVSIKNKILEAWISVEIPLDVLDRLVKERVKEIREISKDLGI